MTSARLTRALIDAGFEVTDAESRGRLMELVTERHVRAIGPPAWRWFVPGRLEVFGKHTDYAGGRSLLGAVPRGFAVAASPRLDGLVIVRDVGRREECVIDSAGPLSVVSGWFTYVAVAVRRLTLNFPGTPVGVDVTLASDLPSAAGLSSSSALIIAVGVAIIRRGQLDSHPSWRVDIRTPEDLSGYFGALERGADFGALAGTTAVGTFGGSEDHTAILTCRPGLLSSYRFVPIRPIGETAMPPEWTFVIASSGVEADKAGRARDSYNRASLAAGALAELWHLRFGPPQMTLAELLASRPDADAVLASLIDETDRPDFDRGVLSRRLRHFVAEDARVPEALRAFTNADGETLGALSQASQDDAGRLLQNQTEETEALARLARGNGAFAASSFGAGFGGSVWALAPVDDAPGFGQRWTKEYRTRFPRASGVEWFLARPGPSVVEV